MAIVMQTNVPIAALRPLAINLSFLNRIPRREAMIEYAVTTNPRTRANWPNCAMIVLFSASCYAGRRFLFVFGSALGLHLVCSENSVTSEIAFDDGLRPVHK